MGKRAEDRATVERRGQQDTRPSETQAQEKTPRFIEEEVDPCVLGTCTCRVYYKTTGRPVPPDPFAMSIRNKYD